MLKIHGIEVLKEVAYALIYSSCFHHEYELLMSLWVLKTT
jgi:hypothetical protein